MERFTTDGNELIKQIRSELLEYESEKDWKEVFTYAELPYFLTYAWSYHWSIHTKTSNYKLSRKEWNAKYDFKRFKNGIYNLDRLAIKKQEIPIHPTDEKYFCSIDWKKINKVQSERIVLDGLICELRIAQGEKLIQWNADSEMNQDLNKLIYTMRHWKREMKE